MYTVWAEGAEQSIPLEDLDDAKEFALESNMLSHVVDDATGETVWSVTQNLFSRFYKE